MTFMHKHFTAMLAHILGLTLLLLSTAMATAKFECIGTYGGQIDSYLVYQHYLYLAKGYNLQVLDITDPSQPQEVGWLRTSGLIQSMDISGHTLYLGTFSFKGGLDLDEEGVKILDLSNPVRPVMRGTIKSASRNVQVKVMGSYLLVNLGGKYSSYYEVYDIKDSLHPKELESGNYKWWWNSFITDGKNLFVRKKHDQLQDGPDYKLAIIDKITSRTLATLTFPDESSPDIRLHKGAMLLDVAGTSQSVKLTEHGNAKDAWVYCQGLTSIETHGDWTLQKSLWDRGREDDGIQVEQFGSVILRLKESEWDSSSAMLVDSALYAIDHKGNLHCYDLTNSKAVRELDVFPKTMTSCNRILVSGNLALVDHEKGLAIFDITKPLKPVPVGSGIQSVKVHGFKIADRKAYFADGEGLAILDLAQPDHPQLLGRLQNSKLSRVRAVEDNLVFVDDGKEEPSELFVVDCSKPASPTLVGNWHGPLGPMSSSSSRLTIAADKAGLLILDSSKPSAIKQIGTWPTKDPCTDLVTSGTLVYLLAKDLQIVDTSNPAKPIMLGQLKIGGQDEEDGTERFSLKKMGNFLFLIHQKSNGGMSAEWSVDVIDVSTPNAPKMSRHEDHRNTGGNTNPFRGWYLTLPSYEHNSGGTWYGMDILDVSNPSKVDTIVEQYETLRTQVPPALFKDFIYFVDGTGSLVILRNTKE